MNEVLCRKGFSNRACLEPRCPKVAHTNMPRRMERKPRKLVQTNSQMIWALDAVLIALHTSSSARSSMAADLCQPIVQGSLIPVEDLSRRTQNCQQHQEAIGRTWQDVTVQLDAVKLECSILICQQFHPVLASSKAHTQTNSSKKTTCWNTCPQPILAQHPDDM